MKKERKISKHIDCCRIRFKKYEIICQPDKDYGSGCDLIIANKEKKIIILCEVKRGSISTADINDAIKEIETTLEKIKNTYKRYRVIKTFIHCGGGRFYSKCREILIKKGIYKLTSNHDIDKQLEKFI